MVSCVSLLVLVLKISVSARVGKATRINVDMFPALNRSRGQSRVLDAAHKHVA
jgi:hypothetical protein